MTGAVATEHDATAPQERGWRWFVLALIGMLVITSAPNWPSALALVSGAVRLLLPIEEFALLVLVSIAACAVVGWWAGGGLIRALIWVALTGWAVWKLPLDAASYGTFARGWAIAMAAAFGIVCLTTRSRPFLGRALAAVGIAGAVVVLNLASRASVSGGTFDGVRRTLSADYERRIAETLDTWQAHTQSDLWQAFAARLPDAASRADRMADVLGAMGASPSAPVGRLPLVLAPALLGLESLLALSLGWAAYHRLSRVRIGPPLSRLSALRFGDQLVWGLVVGATVLMLPTLADWRALGANLVCFFGTLYALRGAAVLSWWAPDRYAVAGLVVLIVLVPVLGPVLLLGALLTITFVLGLGDTWRDFRAVSR